MEVVRCGCGKEEGSAGVVEVEGRGDRVRGGGVEVVRVERVVEVESVEEGEGAR